jgi:hypothetical protein
MIVMLLFAKMVACFVTNIKETELKFLGIVNKSFECLESWECKFELSPLILFGVEKAASSIKRPVTRDCQNRVCLRLTCCLVDKQCNFCRDVWVEFPPESASNSAPALSRNCWCSILTHTHAAARVNKRARVHIVKSRALCIYSQHTHIPPNKANFACSLGAERRRKKSGARSNDRRRCESQDRTAPCFV